MHAEMLGEHRRGCVCVCVCVCVISSRAQAGQKGRDGMSCNANLRRLRTFTSRS